jgi:hypothetical protein
MKKRMLASVSALLFVAAVGCVGPEEDFEVSETAPVVEAEAPEVAQAPPATTAKPTDAPRKLVAPVRGEAEIGYLNPISRRKGNMIITTIRIKNLSKGVIAGLKVDEFWYDKAGQPVTGAQSFRYRKPFLPDEVIDVVLEVPTHPQMDRNQYKFEHANGTIKTTRLQKM